MNEHLFQEEEIVWAKLQGFPPWPAMLFKSWSTVHQWGVDTVNVLERKDSEFYALFLDVLNVNTVSTKCLTPFSIGLEASYQMIPKKKKSLISKMDISFRKARLLHELSQMDDPNEDLRADILDCRSLSDFEELDLSEKLAQIYQECDTTPLVGNRKPNPKIKKQIKRRPLSSTEPAQPVQMPRQIVPSNEHQLFWKMLQEAREFLGPTAMIDTETIMENWNQMTMSLNAATMHCDPIMAGKIQEMVVKYGFQWESISIMDDRSRIETSLKNMKELANVINVLFCETQVELISAPIPTVIQPEPEQRKQKALIPIQEEQSRRESLDGPNAWLRHLVELEKRCQRGISLPKLAEILLKIIAKCSLDAPKREMHEWLHHLDCADAKGMADVKSGISIMLRRYITGRKIDNREVDRYFNWLQHQNPELHEKIGRSRNKPIRMEKVKKPRSPRTWTECLVSFIDQIGNKNEAGLFVKGKWDSLGKLIKMAMKKNPPKPVVSELRHWYKLCENTNRHMSYSRMIVCVKSILGRFQGHKLLTEAKEQAYQVQYRKSKARLPKAEEPVPAKFERKPSASSRSKRTKKELKSIPKRRKKSEQEEEEEEEEEEPKSRKKVKVQEDTDRTSIEMTLDPNAPTPLSKIWLSDQPLTDQPIDLVWDTTIFDDTKTLALPRESAVPVQRRQESIQHSKIKLGIASGNLHPHTMVQCEHYVSAAAPQQLPSTPNTARRTSRGASNIMKSAPQPYKIVIHPEVSFVCDLHSHLAECEIIGFLGGKWDAENQIVYVQAAFPCRSLTGGGYDGSTDVEMDPSSEIQLRDIIRQQNLQVVGWYHSHPQFQPDPSIRDIENQCSYQALFKDHQSDTEPFIGLIVGTYDTCNHDANSVFRYFHCRYEKAANHQDVASSFPMELQVALRRKKIESEKTMYDSVYKVLGFQDTELNVETKDKVELDVRLCMESMLNQVSGTCMTRIEMPSSVREEWHARGLLIEWKLNEMKEKLYSTFEERRRLVDQCLALLDYYSRYEKRVILKEKWKTRPKIDKIQTSLLTHSQGLALSQPQTFVQELMAYLKLAWQHRS